MRKINSINYLLLLSVAFSVFAPAMDTIACNDCGSPFEGKCSGAICPCPCCSAAAGVDYRIFDIALLCGSLDTDWPLMAFSGPVFSIEKPPQN